METNLTPNAKARKGDTISWGAGTATVLSGGSARITILTDTGETLRIFRSAKEF